MIKGRETKDGEDLSKLLASISKDELIEIVKHLLSNGVEVLELIKEKRKVSEGEIWSLVKKEGKGQEGVKIPCSVFNNKELSALETIVKYLRENLKLRYNEIASILNRDERNIWTTYRNAKAKRKQMLVLKKKEMFIPVEIFKNRKLSVLENLASYLKENNRLTYREIAKLLNRNERTIWTVYHRAKIKNEI